MERETGLSFTGRVRSFRCAIVGVRVMLATQHNAWPRFLTDVASPQFHPLAAKAKDVAAGAVLISALGALVIGLIIFLPRLLR